MANMVRMKKSPPLLTSQRLLIGMKTGKKGPDALDRHFGRFVDLGMSRPRMRKERKRIKAMDREIRMEMQRIQIEINRIFNQGAAFKKKLPKHLEEFGRILTERGLGRLSFQQGRRTTCRIQIDRNAVRSLPEKEKHAVVKKAREIKSTLQLLTQCHLDLVRHLETIRSYCPKEQRQYLNRRIKNSREEAKIFGETGLEFDKILAVLEEN